jgi:hypothetical protein
MGDQPCRKAATYTEKHKRRRNAEICIPRKGFDPTIQMFGRALNCADAKECSSFPEMLEGPICIHMTAGLMHCDRANEQSEVPDVIISYPPHHINVRSFKGTHNV